METPKLGPVEEAIIKARMREAEKKKNLPPEQLKGWTNGADDVVAQRVMDSTNPDLQDMSTDPAEARKKQLLAMKEYDLGHAKKLEKEEKKFMGSFPKVPWWKRFTR